MSTPADARALLDQAVAAIADPTSTADERGAAAEEALAAAAGALLGLDPDTVADLSQGCGELPATSAARARAAVTAVIGRYVAEYAAAYEQDRAGDGVEAAQAAGSPQAPEWLAHQAREARAAAEAAQRLAGARRALVEIAPSAAVPQEAPAGVHTCYEYLLAELGG